MTTTQALTNLSTAGISQTTLGRWLSKVFIGDECWLWRGSVNGWGYGFTGDGRHCKTILTHRVAWIIWYGPIPDGMFVLHKCDNPPCIRPDHLFLGTTKDNTDDMIRKGRQNFLGNAKISAKDAVVIREMERAGYDRITIAAMFGIDRSQVCRIVNFKRWAAG